MILKLPPLSVLDLVGKDAAAILNNLTTNAVKTLQPSDPGVETFITNLKGKCVGHVMVFRTAEGYRLIGAGGQSEAIAALMDRYTIREDAQPRILDQELAAYLVVDESVPDESVPADLPESSLYEVPWLAPTPAKLILTATAADATVKFPDALDGQSAVDRFQALRLAAGFPWYGTDFDDSHLPQEIDREPQTISFTKGCYLGQETIARLDALGQVQKKLVRWSIQGFTDAEELPAVDTKLFATTKKPVPTGDTPAGKVEKPVGRLTSVARDPSGSGRVLALGFARRSHFAAGAEAIGTIGEREFVAEVVQA